MMKIYYPDDPIKQEMLEALIVSYETFMKYYKNNINRNKVFKAESILKIAHALKLTIERATGLKIEEIIS